MNWKRGISTTVSVLLSLILLGSGSAEARPRVAFLTLGDQQMDAVYVAAFVEGLRRLGYVEGRNLDIDYRYTAGAVERLKPLAQELVALQRAKRSQSTEGDCAGIAHRVPCADGRAHS
jgi:hypothetical protein